MNHGRDEAPQKYPYDSLGERDDFDEALDTLRASRKDGKPHIPTFAQRMLRRLREVGLLHRTDTESPVNVRKAKMAGEQEVWVRYDTRRDEDQGYMAIEVVDAPRSDVAIFAAMVAWLAPHPIDVKQLLEAQEFDLSGAYAAEEERIRESIGMEMVGGFPTIGEDKDNTYEDLVSAFKSLSRLEARREALKPMQYIVPLIRYYRPDFNSRSPKEQQELIRKTCDHLNDFLNSLRRLHNFLEYGAPKQKKLTPTVENPKRYVQAAILRDVDGLTNVEIGKRMGVHVEPAALKKKGDHSTVRGMVRRGRDILTAAFGEKGWRERVEKMKAEKAWWQSLGQEERNKIIEEATLALDQEYYKADY